MYKKHLNETDMLDESSDAASDFEFDLEDETFEHTFLNCFLQYYKKINFDFECISFLNFLLFHSRMYMYE